MPKVSDMMPSKWLKASDVDEDGIILTIRTVEEETIGQGANAEDKWVLYFKELDKGMVLNKTNMTTIAKLCGDETDEWEGKRITLYSTETLFEGKTVECIRVKSKPPKAAAAKNSKAAASVTGDDPVDEDQIPF